MIKKGIRNIHFDLLEWEEQMEQTTLYAYIKFSGNDDFPLDVVT